jgi:uncharacterized protein
MKVERKKCMTVFIEDSDMWHGERLHEAIVRLLHKHGIAGATAISGMTGFGAHGRIHRRGLFGVSDEKPIVIIAIDSEPKIREAVESITPLIREGLIAVHDTEIYVADEHADLA